MSQNAYVKLLVNTEEKQLTGVLPGLTEDKILTTTQNWGWGDMQVADGSNYQNYGTGTASVHLNKGKNTIVLAAQNENGGINVDKIVFSGTNVKLTYVPVKNTPSGQ